jgi:hypothetical protein
MCTRSYIGIQNDDRTISVIYCHFDGYPSGVGQTLLNFYSEKNKIRELLKLGDISSLGKEIGEKHDFDNYKDNDDCVNAYHRDRGEEWENVKPGIFESVDEFLEKCHEDYTYLFKNGQWFYRNYDNSLKMLTQEVINSEGEE